MERVGLKIPIANNSVPFKLNVLNYMVQSDASLMDTAALFPISSYTLLYSWQKQIED